MRARQWKPKRDLFQLGQLGQSADCSVFLVLDKSSDRYFAVKLLNSNRATTAAKLQTEINILLTLGRDPLLRESIAHFHERYFAPGWQGFLMDYVSWPTLAACTAPVHGIKLGYRLIWILARLLYEHNIVHRDVKRTNILINPETGDLKLIDFGLSIRVLGPNAFAKEYMGTPLYMAPEALKCTRSYLISKMDVFSAGMVILETVNRKHPLEDVTTLPALIEYYDQREGLDETVFPPAPLGLILRDLLQFDFMARPTLFTALERFRQACLLEV
jgi:serine/threonine protein kinase